jgi:hypothetical protein
VRSPHCTVVGLIAKKSRSFFCFFFKASFARYSTIVRAAQVFSRNVWVVMTSSSQLRRHSKRQQQQTTSNIKDDDSNSNRVNPITKSPVQFSRTNPTDAVKDSISSQSGEVRSSNNNDFKKEEGTNPQQRPPNKKVRKISRCPLKVQELRLLLLQLWNQLLLSLLLMIRLTATTFCLYRTRKGRNLNHSKRKKYLSIEDQKDGIIMAQFFT